MIDRGKRSVLGVRVNVVDYDAVISKIVAAARHGQPLSVSALAVHGVMTGALDPAQKYRLNRLDILTPDGQPVRWALRLLHGEKLPDRVSGPDLVEYLCRECARQQLSLYLFGSTAAVLSGFTANMQRRFPGLRIAGGEPSQFRTLNAFERQALLKRIAESGANLLFVGLGCPRQEVFAFENTLDLKMPVLAVGAAFDFHAGSLKRAPQWMRACGLEWVSRLAADPARLWRRYLLLNPLFLWMICLQWLGLNRRRTDHEKVPESPLYYG